MVYMVKRVKTREEIEDKYKWDLSMIYVSDDDWFKDYEDVMSNCEKYLEFKGKLNSADMILKYYEFHQEIRKKFESVYTYAYLKFYEDTSNVHYRELREKVRKLSSEMSSKKSWVLSELRQLFKEDFDRFMEEEPRLKIYDYEFKNILNGGGHGLSKEDKKLISSLREVLNNSEDTFNALMYSDMKFGVIKDGDGNEVELSNTNYSRYIRDNNREVRKSAFYTLYQRYEEMQNIFANLYSAKVSADNVIALREGYNDAREAALFGDENKLNIYDSLIDVLHKNLYIMDEYYALKKEVMGLDEIHIYDIYGPLKDCWEKTKYKLMHGVKLTPEFKSNGKVEVHNDLPGMGIPGSIAHVRPHASRSFHIIKGHVYVNDLSVGKQNAFMLPNGDWMTKQSF